jgi:molecular chaperone GrpE
VPDSTDQSATPKVQPAASGTAASPDSASSPPGAIQARIQELEAQVKEKENKYLYLYADFENFKKRSIKERSDSIKFGWEPVARDLLECLDNLERALEHLPPKTDANLAEGLKVVTQHFRATLQKQGVQPVVAQGAPFDLNLHEAVGQEPSDRVPSGHVLKEQSRGYTLHGRLLRPARVIVSGGKNPA